MMAGVLPTVTAMLLLVNSAQATDLNGDKSAEPATPEITQVPGEDIFGFTSPTDVGSPGDKGIALENDGAVGKRQGRYRAITQKLEFSRTFAENWSYAASIFGVWTSLCNHPDFPDRSAYGFDGVSVEFRDRVIQRSATNPFALTLAIEPRFGRIDTFSGMRSISYSGEVKIQIDAPISDRLFWGMNANFGTGRARDPFERTWASSSNSALSTAIAYAVVDDKFWAGAEARWRHAWSTGFFGTLEGQAFYFGPTIAFKPAANVTVNAVVLPQIAGKARGAPSPLDLDSFERANYRVKIAVGF